MGGVMSEWGRWEGGRQGVEGGGGGGRRWEGGGVKGGGRGGHVGCVGGGCGWAGLALGRSGVALGMAGVALGMSGVALWLSRIALAASGAPSGDLGGRPVAGRARIWAIPGSTMVGPYIYAVFQVPTRTRRSVSLTLLLLYTASTISLQTLLTLF